MKMRTNMSRCIRGISLLATAVLVMAQTPVWAQPDRAREYVKLADAATRALRAATYQAKLETTGALKGKAPEWAGEVKFKKVDADIPLRAKVRLAGKLHNPGAAPVKHVTASDGSMIRELSVTDNVLFQGGVESTGLDVLMSYLRLLVLVLPEPYGDELSGTLTSQGKSSISGAECHVIHVTYQNAASAVLHIGVDDHLLRKVEVSSNIDGEAGSISLTIASIDKVTAIADSEFVLKAPEGCTVKNYPERKLDRPVSPDHVVDVYKEAITCPLRFDTFVVENAKLLRTEEFNRDLRAAHDRVVKRWKYHEERSVTTPGFPGPTHNEHYYEAEKFVKVKWFLEAIWAVVFEDKKFAETKSGIAACTGARAWGEEEYARLVLATMNQQPLDLLKRQ